MLLYIHIPFCDSKCHYCAFNSYVDLFSFKKQYMEALKLQLENQLKKYNKKIETIFIGGGTPSTVEAGLYEDIFKVIEPFKLEKNIEITTEANPNSASKNWLENMYNLGVNRVSFGVQSFDDKKLNFLGRSHNKNQAIKAIEEAANVGFKNINCDIIYDTACDTNTILKKDFQILGKLPVNHVSSYSLTIEEGTKFYKTPEVQKENEENSRYIFKLLEDIGIYQYEISNFAKDESARCKHNIGYWNYTEYLGIGSGAVGTIETQRTYGQKDVLEYIQTPLKYEQIEILKEEDIIIEKILLGFRSIVGVECTELTKEQLVKVEHLIDENKVLKKGNKIFAKDYLLADELALYLTL